MNANSSSTLTAGDALSLGADLIKLLTPVLKKADKTKFENLKKNPQAVQEVFRRMLNGEPIVKDYGDPSVSATIPYRNTLVRDGLEPFVFDKAVNFTVCTSRDSRYLSVTVVAWRGDELIKGWEHTFTKLKSTMESEGFVSIKSVNEDLIFRVQNRLIAEKGELTFRRGSDDCRINLVCGKYNEEEPIPWEMMRMLLPKGKEVTT